MLYDSTQTFEPAVRFSLDNMPPIIFGTSGLGNLFIARDETFKLGVLKECIEQSTGTPVFDTAGKYGAGLALETLGRCLKKLNVQQDDVIISNKLGWLRSELISEEPTFEPGVWKELEYDAIQKISYDGIMECFKQGNELLDGYIPQMVSVHDPDEYLANAWDERHDTQLYEDILDAYEALFDLKQKGLVKAVGVGAKNWRVIKRIGNDVSLDWIMFANSMTIKSHPQELVEFIYELKNKGIVIINSAVFHSGFLVGGEFYDYKLLEPGKSSSRDLLKWRAEFFALCKGFMIKPAEACVQFALNIPGVSSVAMNSSDVDRVRENLAMASIKIPSKFWDAMKDRGLISKHINTAAL